MVAVFTLPFMLSFLAAEVADRSERLRNMMFGLLLAGLSVAFLAVLPHTVTTLLVCGMVSMFGYAIALPSVSAVVTLVSPRQLKGSATAVFDLTMFGAIMVSSPILGALIDAFGWSMTFIFFGSMLVFMGVLVFGLKFRWHERNVLYHVNHPKSKKLPYTL
jgi:MFS family permease